MPSLIKKIATDFGLSEATIHRLTATAPRRYKVYEIKKQSGTGTRVIAQPAREIKTIQRYLVENALNQLPVHDAAYAYVRGKSIKENANAHSQNKYLLKMDFNNFFPSIGRDDLIHHIKKYMPNAYDEFDLNVIASICLWRPKYESRLRLSIGGPSSPFISNTIMYDFDLAISNACNLFGSTYTRYADDLTFSTNTPRALGAVEEIVRQTLNSIQYPRLSIKEQKTVHSSKKFRRMITGLVVTNEGDLSLGRERKRNIRSAVHRALNGHPSSLDPNTLLGHLAFASNIEKSFIDSLQRKYGEDFIDRIKNMKSPA